MKAGYIGQTFDREYPGISKRVVFRTPWDEFVFFLDPRTIEGLNLYAEENRVYTVRLDKNGLSMGIAESVLSLFSETIVWRGDDPAKDDNAIEWGAFWTHGEKSYAGKAAHEVFAKLKAAYRPPKRKRGARDKEKNRPEVAAAVNHVLWDRRQEKERSWNEYKKEMKLTISGEALRKAFARAHREPLEK